MEFVDIDVLAGETVIILARWYGQIVRIGETFHLADGDDTYIVAYGTGTLSLGSGDWDHLAIITGQWVGGYFDGGMNSEVSALNNDVYRRINGGEWVRIATQVPKQSTILDTLPILNGLNEYKATAISDLPSSTDSNISEVQIAEPGWCYVNFGPGFSEFLRIWGNMKLTGAIKREKEFHRYAGRKRRVVTFGEPVDLNLSIAGRITPDASSLYEWEALEEAGEVICWRDPKGRRIFGVLDGISHTHTHPRLVDVSFTVEEIDYAEPAI